MNGDEPHREFLLAALRAASARARLMEADINAIGVALKSDLIGMETALQWIMEAGLLGMVGALPEDVGRLAATPIAEPLRASNGRPIGDDDSEREVA